MPFFLSESHLGKKLVVIVGTCKALAIGIHNDKTQKRFTRLKERLSGVIQTD